jgi:hypothetical protein
MTPDQARPAPGNEQGGKLWREDLSDHDPIWLLLADMRAAGWRVAVHNDYEGADGWLMTFWLFTHPNGFWAKGEAVDDQQALIIARRQAQQRAAGWTPVLARGRL